MTDDTDEPRKPLASESGLSDLAESPKSQPRLSKVFHRMRSLVRGRKQQEMLRQTLEELIEESEANTNNGDEEDNESNIPQDQLLLLRNILAMRYATVYSVMVPRAQIVAIDVGLTFQEMLNLVSSGRHSRYPVYDETLDKVIGMIHIRDVLVALQRQETPPLRQLLRPVLFVSPASATLNLLFEMRTKRIHLAMVVDEYGGIDGLVTIEDLVEQIVGDIHDEYDREGQSRVTTLPDGALLVEARMPIEELEQRTGLKLLSREEETEIDTVGGLVVSMAGMVPHAGDSFTHKTGLIFEIVAAQPHRLELLRLRLPEVEATEL